MKGAEHDPRGLIQEAYRIDGITGEECRSIFLDWALGVPMGEDATDWVRQLLNTHSGEPQEHPMTQTLVAALDKNTAPRRRGGRSGRQTT